VLSMVDNLKDVQRSLAAGARGYVLKEAGAGDLLDAIRSVLSGGEYVQPSLGAAAARGSPAESGSSAELVARLSAREQQVLELIALGHTNAEIAQQLSITPRTVETHRGHILQKLGVRSRAELVRLAVEAQLVEFWEP
jgi:DNA-binding NarL/FixJ family response regulator